MTIPSLGPGAVVLLDFPFTDGAGLKRRPVVVLLDLADADLVVAPITSRLRRSPYHVEITLGQSAGLLRPSVVRVHKLTTVQRSLARSPMGALQLSDRHRLVAVLSRLWSSVADSLMVPPRPNSPPSG